MKDESARKMIGIIVYFVFGAAFCVAALLVYLRYRNLVVALMLLVVGGVQIVTGIRRRNQVEGVDY